METSVPAFVILYLPTGPTSCLRSCWRHDVQLTLSETQTMLQDTANRLLRDRYSFEHRKKILAGHGERLWNAFAELGLLGIEIGEDCGGAAGSFSDLAVVLEAMGRHLVVEPFLPTVVLCAGLIAENAAGDARASLLQAIAEGRLKVRPGAWRTKLALCTLPRGDARASPRRRLHHRRGQVDGAWRQ